MQLLVLVLVVHHQCMIRNHLKPIYRFNSSFLYYLFCPLSTYEGRTESHEQHFCMELGIAD